MSATERFIPVPESALRKALLALEGDYGKPPGGSWRADLVACLPEPEPTFTDEEALALCQALWPLMPPQRATENGRIFLNRLLDAGWTPPKALCPPPPPALVELVEAARGLVCNVHACGTFHDRLRAAVAAYEREEG